MEFILDDDIRAEAIRISATDSKHFLKRSHIDGKIDDIIQSLPKKGPGTISNISNAPDAELRLPDKRTKQEELEHHLQEQLSTEAEHAVWI